MCDYRDPNANKYMKLQIWSFELWNFKYRVSLLKKLHIWNYRMSFGDTLKCYYYKKNVKFFFFWKEEFISSRPNILRNLQGQSGSEAHKFFAFRKNYDSLFIGIALGVDKYIENWSTFLRASPKRHSILKFAKLQNRVWMGMNGDQGMTRNKCIS